MRLISYASLLLRGHALARLRAAAALGGAWLHAFELLTACGAAGAHLRARSAGESMQVRTREHELRAGPADFSAVHHDAEVLRLGMLSALFQAVVHRHLKTYLVALHTAGNALVHLGVGSRAHSRWVSAVRMTPGVLKYPYMAVSTCGGAPSACFRAALTFSEGHLAKCRTTSHLQPLASFPAIQWHYETRTQ